jgi:hypothetical protein
LNFFEPASLALHYIQVDNSYFDIWFFSTGGTKKFLIRHKIFKGRKPNYVAWKTPVLCSLKTHQNVLFYDFFLQKNLFSKHTIKVFLSYKHAFFIERKQSFVYFLWAIELLSLAASARALQLYIPVLSTLAPYCSSSSTAQKYS